MDGTRHHDDDIDSLRAQLAEWRRRAEVAEAIAAERLARVETAEAALATAEAALRSLAATDVAVAPPSSHSAHSAGDAAEEIPVRPRSLLERWRRYTDSIT